MKQQITSRYDSTKVLFECDVHDTIESGLAMRHVSGITDTTDTTDTLTILKAMRAEVAGMLRYEGPLQIDANRNFVHVHDVYNLIDETISGVKV